MSRKVVIITLLLLAAAFRTVAQEDETEEDDLFHHTIDSAMAISPLYLPTSYTELGTIFFKPVDYKVIDTTINRIAQHDPLEQTINLCQTLGIIGQAHKFINFTYEKEPGFALFTFPFPLYFKEQEDLEYYDLKTVYTNLGFTYSVIPKQYMLTATHTQNIRDKVKYAINLRGLASNGYYTNQRTSNIVADALIHYEIPSQIYGFRASYIVNYYNPQENGGLLSMEDFVKQDSLDPTKNYNMKLYHASTRLLTHDLLFQQYVNIIAPNKRKEKNNYWDTFMHTFRFKHQRVNYNDYDLDTLYYGTNFFLSPDTTADTTRFYTLSNTLQWSSFKPYKGERNDRYFFHFTGGITYEYTRFAQANYIGHALIPFAQIHTRLFSVMDIHGRIFYTLGGYQNNDLNARAAVSWAISRKHRHFLGANIDYYFRTPDYSYTYFFSNAMYWKKTDWKKQNILHFSAYWEREGYKAEFSYYMLHNYAVIDETWRPKAIDKYVNIIQIHLFAPIYVKGFGANFNVWVQYSNNKEIQVPIFAGKMDAFYRLNIFKNKAKLQFGFAMAYNTNYYADGYCPMLYSFYTQNMVKVGNYLYFDPSIAIQVQRIALYFKVTHVLCGAIKYRYFTTPDYPMEGRQFVLGLTWRFFD